MPLSPRPSSSVTPAFSFRHTGESRYPVSPSIIPIHIFNSLILLDKNICFPIILPLSGRKW